jgi:hypothetical protein
MTEQQIYCKPCKNRVKCEYYKGRIKCKKGKTEKDFDGDIWYFTDCSCKNKNLDCADFEPKLFYIIKQGLGL